MKISSYLRFAIFAMLSTTTAACVYGCTGSPDVQPAHNNLSAVPRSKPIASSQVIGWINFNSEIQIYAKQANVGQKYDQSCISGRFATLQHQHKAGRRFQGKKVVVTGTLLNAAQYMSAHEFDPTLQNYCASDEILIVRTIALAP